MTPRRPRSAATRPTDRRPVITLSPAATAASAPPKRPGEPDHDDGLDVYGELAVVDALPNDEPKPGEPDDPEDGEDDNDGELDDDERDGWSPASA